MNGNFSPGYRHPRFEETNCKISLSEKSTEIIDLAIPQYFSRDAY